MHDRVMSRPVLQQDEKASRIRDNKRRHRARRKEYLQDLEQRVALAHEQGVKATVEVQLAAQRVAQENVKLRSLLKKAGVNEDSIKAWLDGSACPEAGKCEKTICIAPQKKTRRKVDLPSDLDLGEKAKEVSESSERTLSPSSLSVISGQNSHLQQTLSSRTKSHLLGAEASITQTIVGNCRENRLLPQIDKLNAAPCRLLASLSEGTTEKPFPEGRECSSGSGMECSTAYRTLMQYATSQDKMDRIAAALDSGCTPSEAGGCKVKSSIVWKILDEEC